MGDPMKIRATLKGDSTEVKILVSHDMETGQRKDSAGNVIPAHFITEFTVDWNNKRVLDSQFGTAIAKNPYLSFKFKGGAKGDKITASWVDNTGDKRTDETQIN